MSKDELIFDCEVIHSDIVEKVKKEMTNEEVLTKAAKFFKIFGDPTRMKIISALDINEMCVCDLAVLLNMTKSAISHQLRTLKEANLVKFRRDGKVVFYSLSDNHVKAIYEIGLEHISHS